MFRTIYTDCPFASTVIRDNFIITDKLLRVCEANATLFLTLSARNQAKQQKNLLGLVVVRFDRHINRFAL